MPDDPHRIELAFAYESTKRAAIVERSVAREVGEIDDDRSRTRIDREGDAMRIEIRARDHVALRAAVNTWCSLVDVAERVSELAGPDPAGPE